MPENLCQPAARVHHRRVELPVYAPVSLLEALRPQPPFVLLDSAGGHPSLCRRSYLAWEPRLRLRIKDGRALMTSASGAHEIKTADPFALLRELLELMNPSAGPSAGALAAAARHSLLPEGGAFGMIGYDAGRYIESLPDSGADDLEVPDLDFIFPRKLICFDHEAGAAHLFFEDSGEAELDAVTAALLGQHQEEFDVPDETGHDYRLSSGTVSNFSEQSFGAIVRRAKEYIAAGDIFQSNLSQRLEIPYGGSTLRLYGCLRRVNPSPFAGLLCMGDYDLVSSSPERLVQLSGRRVQTRPIAGTRRRGIDDREDGDLTRDLNLDPKERAEHIMLVDLERNDMGRVCDYGSVEVDELMVNEAYSHVIHIVSNVCGTLHPKKDALDLLRAMFPGGTITGCPKVRCMEIIDELEPVRRGAYTGSFGYISFGGDMDMNIIIRTLVRRGGRLYAQAGAGIVADSNPKREYRECLRKAEALVRAVELAGEAGPGVTQSASDARARQ